ncbi:proton-conducting transporter membrane subunit [Methanoregula sp.]|uniref:proton-conducting transporter transmembrane domain-containing protein n=1 Tax=Methanoregula sp. TaxID=2052170 RepID=UPI00356A3340
MLNLLFYVVIVLFLAGTLVSLLGAARDLRIVRILSLACTTLASILLAALSLLILVTGVPFTPAAWQLFPGFSVEFFIDRLAAFFLFLIGMVSSCVAVYTAGYVEHMEGGNRRNLLCGCISLFVLSMALIVASENTISFLLFWELMAAVSFFLVMYEYSQEETRKAGIFYFVMTHLSTLFVMLGFIALYYASGSFAIAPLHTTPASLPLVTAAFLSLFVGFSIKAGIIPFHKWLPYAHPASPSPVSALMSGVMLKVAVYGLIRIIITVFSPDLWWGVLILIAGIASAVLGVIYALKEHDIKGMLAYSSIENIGIIFVGIGLFVIFSCSGLAMLATLSLIAALFHSLNHALFKSLLFLTAGSVVHATHTRDIEKMGGLSGKMPCTSVLFFTGAIAIAALPPLNGFASELLMYIAFFQSVTVVDPLIKVLLFICLALFALTSALSAACFVKAFGSIFLAQPRSKESEAAREVSLPMLVGPAILATACVILGVFAFQILTAFGYALPIPDLFLVSMLLLIMAALTYVVLYFTASREVRISETWGCGAKSQPSSTEYTGHGFSEPIVTIFSSIYRTKKAGTKKYYDQHDCIFAEGTAEIRLLKFFEEYLYLPIARGATRATRGIARIQNGCLDTYLLYVFIAVVAIILFLGWSA